MNKYLTDFEGGKRLNYPDDIEALLINIQCRTQLNRVRQQWKRNLLDIRAAYWEALRKAANEKRDV